MVCTPTDYYILRVFGSPTYANVIFLVMHLMSRDTGYGILILSLSILLLVEMKLLMSLPVVWDIGRK